MPDLGLEVLLKGSNMLRLLQGLWVALRISLIAVVISIPLGLLFGVLMTRKNVVLKAIFRVYLEFIRIMPQLVLLFLFYFSTTRTFGWNLSGETASIIVFVLWGTAEMSDLVRGALISIPKHQYESSAALGLTKMQTCNGVQREHNKKLNNGLPILHKVPPKRDYGRYFCIMAEKGGTSHGGLTEKLSLFFHAKKQEVNAYGR